MLKRPVRNIAFMGEGIVLYDRAKSDLFVQNHHRAFIDGAPYDDTKPVYRPSITTIFLLQVQASIIQAISALPPKHAGAARRFLVVALAQQVLRWALLFSLLVLDNVAHILNVEGEMADVKEKNRNSEERHYNRQRDLHLQNHPSPQRITYPTADSAESDNGYVQPNSTMEEPDLPSKEQERTEHGTEIKEEQNEQNHGHRGPIPTKPSVSLPTQYRCPRPCCENPEPTKSVKTTSSMPSSPSSPTPTYSILPLATRARKVSSPSALISVPTPPKKVDHLAVPASVPKMTMSRSHSSSTIRVEEHQQQEDDDATQRVTETVQPKGGSVSSQLLTSQQRLRRTNAQRDLTTKPAMVTPVEKRTKPVVTTKKSSITRGHGQVKPVVVNPSKSTGNSSASSQNSSPVSASHPTTTTITNATEGNTNNQHSHGYAENTQEHQPHHQSHHHHSHHHHHHHETHHNSKPMDDYIHDNRLIRKETQAPKPTNQPVIPWRA
ncbi:hypothetical protein EC973_007632 [Apophysomyces ossiformis]|uniref:Uncharacterized protein n=1 Tax=Apophysomyces ossiformis TaxID=679940 RepID=A0A8H7BTT5_9FUNG|nr:hypothetical protein EC973_007632 [Apophysomyces ossiformis]